MTMSITDLMLYDDSGPVLDPDDNNWNPTGVRGINKVVQRVIYALLTPKGSVVGRPQDGSPFLQLANNFRSEFDVFAAFSASEPSISSTVEAAEEDTDPDSERYADSNLLGLVFNGNSSITLQLKVLARDGTTTNKPIEFTVNI